MNKIKKRILKGLKNTKDKNDELLNTLSATSKASKSDALTYNTKYSFSKLKNTGYIKKSPLNLMFNLMKEHHKKFNSFIDLKPRSSENKSNRLEVIIHAGNIYSKLYNIYRSKYYKKIDSLSAKNKKKLYYKHLKISGDGRYSSDEEQEEQEEQKEQESIKVDYKTFIKQITDEEKDINDQIFKKYFKVQRTSDMLVFLKRTNDTEKNNELVNLINSGLKDLKEEIKKMSKEEIEIEKPYNIVKVVEKILKFNKQNQQKGQGIKILTPNQMLNRLPIALAQLNAGNNSNKLKNEIRQLLYSLYRSKNMTEQIYKSLIGII